MEKEMKKGLLVTSLVLLFAAIGLEYADVDSIDHLVAYACLGTGILGALYPAY